MKYKIFVASSMTNEFRTKIQDIATNVAKHTNTKFEVFAYGQNPMVDVDIETQKQINNKIIECDIFILLVDNNKVIGKETIREYRTAHQQSIHSPSKRPFIKAFAILGDDDKEVKLTYRNDKNEELNFEELLYNDSKRYVQYQKESEFLDFFDRWLTLIAHNGIEHTLFQDQLSYGDHLYQIAQGGIRENNEKYFYRIGLDDKIRNILEFSPIVILEGNTYSGKTRAAFELMKHNEAWKDYFFHVYGSNYTVDTLNDIKLNFSGNDNKGDVYLFDDINDIIHNGAQINRQSELWAKLNGYNQNKGFNLSDFGNTRIIMTVSGRLSDYEKQQVYSCIFNNSSSVFESKLKDIIVNFDVYNPASFRSMTDEMVRSGILSKDKIRPGNFTIGSLFIKYEDICRKSEEMYRTNAALITTLVAQRKYAPRSKFTGQFVELKELYKFIQKEIPGDEILKKGIERLRGEGLIIVADNGDEGKRIFVDKYILEAFTEVVNTNLEYNDVKDYALNRLLIDYANTCPKNRGEDGAELERHINSICQMGYLLVDRNNLPNEEIYKLICYISQKIDPGSTEIRKTARQGDISALVQVITVIDKYNDPYAPIFTYTAISKINDFKKVCSILDELKKQSQLELYKRVTYAVLDGSSGQLTMQEEHTIMNHIFDADGKWQEPFNEEDLKDVFYLKRITPYLKNKSIVDIITLLPCARVSLADSNSEYIFQVQVSAVIVNCMCRAKTYKEFSRLLDKLKEICKEAPAIKNVVADTLTKPFYEAVPKVIQHFTYEDRYKFFTYLLKIDDKKGVLGDTDVAENSVLFYKGLRIIALNCLLEYLDEDKALIAYSKILKKHLNDAYTLSMLLKNSFLSFEQLLPLAIEAENKGYANYLIRNQLIGKAETITDALACLDFMKIKDANPAKLQDEGALLHYLNIKEVDAYRCIEIIKERRRRYAVGVSESIVGVLINKLKIDPILDIFLNQDETDDYYMDNYGLLYKEVQNARSSVILINKLIKRAAESKSRQDVVDKINTLFNNILNDNELQYLIIDPDRNERDSILSVYIKFSQNTYKDAKEFYNALQAKYNLKKTTDNIYSTFMWYIVMDYRNKTKSREDSITLMNKELLEVYRYFKENFYRVDVVNMMSKLYGFRPMLCDENLLEINEEFVCEENKLHYTFREYLDYLKAHHLAYVNKSFIYNALAIMQQDTYPTEIFDLLGEIAYTNRIGVQYDTILQIHNKQENVKYGLSPSIRRKLLHFNKQENRIEVDRRFVHNISYCKILWYILQYDNSISTEDIEECQNNQQITPTQTYLNMLFRKKGDKVKNDARFDMAKLTKGYDGMITYMNDFLAIYTHLQKSIQMCLSLIAIAPNKELLDKIFDEHGFGEFKTCTEVISACMNRKIQFAYANQVEIAELLKEFKKTIIDNCTNINIYSVNAYINLCIHVVKTKKVSSDNIQDILNSCWKTLSEERKIDLFILLDTNEAEKKQILEKVSYEDNNDRNQWMMDANIQTFSYFSLLIPKAIIIADCMFDKNYCYDLKGKKSCLKDIVKNIRNAYQRDANFRNNAQVIEKLGEILSRKEHYNLFKEICDKYILKSTQQGDGSWVGMPEFYEKLLTVESFKKQVAYYISSLIKHNYNGGRHSKKRTLYQLDINDTNRIGILKESLKSVLNPIVVAGVGHRFITEKDIIKQRVSDVLKELNKLGQVIVCTSYAYGSDQIIAQCAVDLGITTRAVLPYQKEHFLATVKKDAEADKTSSLRHEKYLKELLQKAEKCDIVEGDSENPYEKAAEYLITNSTMIIAIWDGIKLPLINANGQSINRGGTYDCICKAKEMNKETIIINCKRK